MTELQELVKIRKILIALYRLQLKATRGIDYKKSEEPVT